MTAEACRAAFEAAPVNDRASKLDEAFPQCACEPWALTEAGGDGVADGEKLARILTSPDDYDEAMATVVTSRLTAIYSMGMSVIRQGAADSEILNTVSDLLNGGAEPRRLFGAVVMPASKVREFANDEDSLRWFSVYATDDRGKVHHGDVFGTTVNRKQQSRRRGRFADAMLPLIVKADTAEHLLAELRSAGI